MTESWHDMKQGVRFGVFYVYSLVNLKVFSPNRIPKTHQTAHPVSHRANFQPVIETLKVKNSRCLLNRRMNEDYLSKFGGVSISLFL